MNKLSFCFQVFFAFVFLGCDTDEGHLTCCDFEISYEKEYGLESNWSLVGTYQMKNWKEECTDGAGGWISFKEDGTFSGSSSCNAMGGKYKVSDSDKISLTDWTQTLRGCIGNGSEYWEEKFPEELLKADRFEIDGNKLTIHTTGQTKLVFIAFEMQ